MSGGLKMPRKGQSARLLSELNAEHAPSPPPSETNERYNVTTLQETNVPDNEPTNADSSVGENQATNEAPVSVDPGEDSARRQPVPRAAKGATASSEHGGGRRTDRQQRLERALESAQKDEIAIVTVRVSSKLNQYIDDYVDRINRIDPKRKYRKQDAIAEAFAAFYADHVMPPAPVDEEL